MKKRRSLTPRAAKPRRTLRPESGSYRVRPPTRETDYASLRLPARKPDPPPPLASVPAPPALASAPAPPAAERRPSMPAPPPERRSRDSHVRLCSQPSPRLGRIDEVEAQDVLEDLAEEVAAIDTRLDRLERAAVSLESHARPRPSDRASEAAFATLDACFAELRRVSEALSRVRDLGQARKAEHVFAGDLSDYLRGLCVWIHASLAAMDQLVAELWAGTPEYAKFRVKIDTAKDAHFDELEAPLLERLATSHLATGDTVIARLRVALEELVYRTRRLEARLDTPMGCVS
jgi:hypothetical protein